MKHIFIIATLILSFSLTTYSQSSKGSIDGQLTDSSGTEVISLATIAVYRVADSSLITYRLSDMKGSFKVPGLPLNDSLRMVITHVGSQVFRQSILLSAIHPDFNMDTIRLYPEFETLEAVVITAEVPPVIVRRDTIEFNADAFKTLPSALVEDLLRKLPGVLVDQDGNISVNGRRVNKLYVDGKEFFGSDPQMATKNLPANIIDKIQVTDDKEQMMMNPDLPIGQVGQVINLKLKRAIKKGWFGKAYAGAGTDNRYETGGLFNLFKDTLQVSLLGYKNNVNKPGFGFSEIRSMGGFDRSGINSLMVRSDGGFALNDISFGGTGNGIQHSTGGGINLNNQIKNNLTLNLQYFYGQINSNNFAVNNRKQFFGDTTMTTLNNSEQVNENYTHRIGGYVKWNIDSASKLEFRPSLTLTRVLGNNQISYNTSNNHNGLLNESENQQNDRNESAAFNQDVSYMKTFKKKGRSLYAAVNIKLSENKNNRENNAQNIFYEDQQNITTLLNQLRKRNLDNNAFTFSANYSEPVSKSVVLRISETLNVFSNRDDINSFTDNNNDRKYDVPVPDLTDGLLRKGFKSTTTFTVRFHKEKWSVTPGVSYQTLNINNQFSKSNSIIQQFNYVLPTLLINVGGWNINYSTYATEPNAADLQPVRNNTNPLYITKGNPLLQPSRTHSIIFYKYNYDTKTNLNYSLNIYGSLQKNAIVYSRTIDNKGVQTTMPINVDRSSYAQISAQVSKQIKFSQDWKFTTGLTLWATFNRNQVLLNDLKGVVNNWWLIPRFNVSFNWKDIFEVRQDLGIDARKSTYSDNLFPSIKVVPFNSSSELIIRWPKHWVWETNLDYRYNPQVVPGIQEKTVKWNAGVNFLFLKEDKGQLKLSVNDLLNQNNQAYSIISENYIEYKQDSNLKRYFMLTFTYNFRNFGGKVGGKDRIFLF